MGISSRPQSQRNSNQSRGTDARAMRGTVAKNKDQLKSRRVENMAGKPAAQLDQYGSRHNDDNLKKEQRRAGAPRGTRGFRFIACLIGPGDLLRAHCLSAARFGGAGNLLLVAP